MVASFLVGCNSSDDEFLASKSSPAVVDSSYLVPEGQAIKRAVAFLNNLEGNVTTNAKQARVRKRVLAGTANDEAKKQEGVYIINFANQGGYAVVSADKRDGANVYLASPEGSFDENSSDLQYLLTTVKEYQASVISSNAFNPDKGDGTTTENTIVLANYGPLLSTCWHQGFPFNEALCDKYPSYKEARNMGCVTVAMGQIVNYFKYPNEISGEMLNWDLITAATGKEIYRTTATDAASHLLYLIGTSLGIKYPSDNSANFEKAKKVFSRLGYTYNTKSGFDKELVRSQVGLGIPVYMRGAGSSEGHAWVADGYKIIKKEYRTYDDEGNLVENTVLNDYNYDEITEYIHLDIGWGQSFLYEKVPGSEYSSSTDHLVWVYSDIFNFYDGESVRSYNKDIKMIYNFQFNR